MGRKAKFTEAGYQKKGPGRKARKQQDPVFPKVKDNGIVKPLSSNQKKRKLKRELKAKQLAEKIAQEKAAAATKRAALNPKKNEHLSPNQKDVQGKGAQHQSESSNNVKSNRKLVKSVSANQANHSANSIALANGVKKIVGIKSVDLSKKRVKKKPQFIVRDLVPTQNEPLQTKKKQKQSPVQKVEDSDKEVSEDDIEMNEGSSEEEPSGFTDDNSSWLKPVSKSRKKQLLGDSDSGNDQESSDENDSDVGTGASVNNRGKVKLSRLDDEDDSDDEDDFSGSDEVQEDDEDTLPIERAAKRLRKRQQEDDKLAEEEMQLNIADKDVFVFPEEGEETPKDLKDIQQRIRDIIVVLSDFKRLRDRNRSRSEYISLLRKDLCTYYSYNEFLMEKLMELFSLQELTEFLEASEVQRPLTIRVNSLKTRRRDLAQALINRGVNLDPVGKWTKVGLVVYSSQVPLGATPEYLAGQYIIQGASSLLPVMALAPKEQERILDMCCAPGGKASHIAAVMKNTGVLFANDCNAERVKAVVGNFHRLGIVNSAITCYDGRKFPSVMKGFDRVLLDAPCTGTGVVSKDPSVKTNKDEVDIQRCCTLQRELILAAIDCLNSKSSTGGYLVYSTCSVLVEENEWIVDYALKKRDVKLVPIGIDFGTDGFTKYRQHRFRPSLKLTKRFYPHTHNMDGFFVAKLQKMSNTIKKTPDEDGDDDVLMEEDDQGEASKPSTNKSKTKIERDDEVEESGEDGEDEESGEDCEEGGDDDGEDDEVVDGEEDYDEEDDGEEDDEDDEVDDSEEDDNDEDD